MVGAAVKVPIPRVTQEFRDQLAKRVAAAAEEARVAGECSMWCLCACSLWQTVRKHRHDALKAAQKHKDAFSKDEMFRLEEELTKLTNAAVKQIGVDCDKKTADVSKAN